MKIVVFWQPFPSMIQAPAIKALNEMENVHCICFFSSDVPPARRAMGWNEPDFGNAEKRFVGKENYGEVVKETVGKYPEAVHVVSSAGSYSLLTKVLFSILKRHSSARIAILSEAGNLSSIRGWVGLLRARLILGRIGSSLKCVITYGEIGRRYFKRAGIAANRTVLTAYQASETFEVPRARQTESPSNAIRILFVGQLVHRKGVDILIRACSLLSAESFMLTIVGGGQEEFQLRKLASRLRLSQIRWLGKMANIELPGLYLRNDLLVVPSRFDGWAAVTNEALLSHLPVIISNACGSADIVYSTGAGVVFNNGCVKDLATALNNPIKDRSLLKKWEKCAEGASAAVTGSAMGRHFYEIVGFCRNERDSLPIAPWQQAPNQSSVIWNV
jgi:glycosyltransferase involved in cell wall biosynthesis